MGSLLLPSDQSYHRGSLGVVFTFLISLSLRKKESKKWKNKNIVFSSSSLFKYLSSTPFLVYLTLHILDYLPYLVSSNQTHSWISETESSSARMNSIQ